MPDLETCLQVCLHLGYSFCACSYVEVHSHLNTATYFLTKYIHLAVCNINNNLITCIVNLILVSRSYNTFATARLYTNVNGTNPKTKQILLTPNDRTKIWHIPVYSYITLQDGFLYRCHEYNSQYLVFL